MNPLVPIGLAILSLSCLSAAAQTLEERYPRGGLIFQERAGAEAAALRQATGSRMTNVGIIRYTGGGIEVIAAADDSVFEEPLEDFIARGVGKRHAVYAVKGIAYDRAWYHPLVLAAYDYLGYPYDRYYRPGDRAIYSAELVHLAGKKIGISLGSPQKLSDLRAENPAVRSWFLSDWRRNPRCKAGKISREACWKRILAGSIVTPASIAKSPRLRLVFSDFER